MSNDEREMQTLRQRVGRKTTSSMGSTSLAITTKFAFFASMRAIQWFKPYLTNIGFLESCVPGNKNIIKGAFS